MSQVDCEFSGEQYVILVWKSSNPCSREKIFRETSLSLDGARKVRSRLQEKFFWCDVKIYHSPKRGVMLLEEA
jgi:hypothetical protein